MHTNRNNHHTDRRCAALMRHIAFIMLLLTALPASYGQMTDVYRAEGKDAWIVVRDVTTLAEGEYGTSADNDECRLVSRLALKTNLLYNVLAIPNIGLEAGFGDRWSADVDWMYAWWSNDSAHRYWRIYGGSIEARHWFTPGAWSGHHLGIYGKMLTYDFELGASGVMGTKWNWSAGLTYGYRIALTGRLGIDLGLAVGYVGGKRINYDWMCGHYTERSRHRNHYVGLTRAEVTLVWTLFDKK